jgi:hypothetical protein
MGTERIDHAAEARLALEWAIEWAMRDVSVNMATETGEYKSDVIAQAQVHATLALVEQQRVANLIALSNVRLEMPGGGTATFIHAFDFDWVMVGDVNAPNFTLKPEIANALGIEVTK